MKQEHKNIDDAYSIFQTGGKQYQAVVGKTLSIEKIEGEDGSKINFDEVVFRKTGKDVFEFGKPFVKEALVGASIIKQMREPKKIIFKFGRRKKIRTKRGHRQPATVIRIESI